ncbi:hypothetical protein Plec18170_007004 [Paecilomyces lecythidis]
MDKAPTPTTPLQYYRVLSPAAGVRVSPICLGAMNFGEAWKQRMGECGKERSFEILDYFYEQGGNFIDTANVYQNGESEEWLGEWMESRGNRNEIVIATKYTTFHVPKHQNGKVRINYQGNHIKNMKAVVEESLERLKSSYVDILYVHWWDYSTSIPELMQGLNHLVSAGKVHYLGASDCPAWVVVKANEYARQHGFPQFSIYQGRYSAAQRDVEREVLPMCEDQGLSFCAYGALGSGNFKTKEQRERDTGEGRNSFTNTASENVLKTVDVLERLAKAKGTQITSVAMAYVMKKSPYVYPLIGCRTVDQLKGNIAALTIKLTDEDIHDIESSVPFEPGFPFSMLFQFYNPQLPYHYAMTTGDSPLVRDGGYIDSVRKTLPDFPHKFD